MGKRFEGFKNGQKPKVALPEQFFSELLPLIDDLSVLKVVLFAWRALMQREGTYRFLCYDDFAEDAALSEGLRVVDASLDTALTQAVAQGVFLRAEVTVRGEDEQLFFMNTPRGREAVARIQAGEWRPNPDGLVTILPERPTIYALYEREIGPLTHGIGERLKDAEETYPYEWIIAAIETAVDNNARSWAYIRAILERRQQEGDANEKLERSGIGDGQRYASGEWSQFIDS